MMRFFVGHFVENDVTECLVVRNSRYIGFTELSSSVFLRQVLVTGTFESSIYAAGAAATDSPRISCRLAVPVVPS